jgi:hypothetical protein
MLQEGSFFVRKKLPEALIDAGGGEKLAAEGLQNVLGSGKARFFTTLIHGFLARDGAAGSCSP